MPALIRCLIACLLLIAAGAHAQQCADGVDNNSNGLIDLTDWYCKSAVDNDESSFLSGIPGDDNNGPATLDCWFDTNSGGGDDGCSIHACCGIDGACPADLAPAQFNPAQCAPSAQCVDNCLPQTKPGCDCFGCCEICKPGTGCVDVFVNPVVSPACSVDVLEDTGKCRRCVQNAACTVVARIFADGFEAAPVQPSLRQALDAAVR